MKHAREYPAMSDMCRPTRSDELKRIYEWAQIYVSWAEVYSILKQMTDEEYSAQYETFMDAWEYGEY